jgi:hypothetical protein
MMQVSDVLHRSVAIPEVGMQPMCNPRGSVTDPGPAIVTVIGTIGGGIVGVFGTLKVTQSSIAADAARTTEAIGHREREAALSRRRDLDSETARARGVARLDA